jgi:hypothetical protein
MTQQRLSSRVAYVLADLESITVRLRQLGLEDAAGMVRQLRVETRREAERRLRVHPAGLDKLLLEAAA